jgi:hypothetical protein
MYVIMKNLEKLKQIKEKTGKEIAAHSPET